MKTLALVLMIAGLALLAGSRADFGRALHEGPLTLDNAASAFGVSTMLDAGTSLRVVVEAQSPVTLRISALPPDRPDAGVDVVFDRAVSFFSLELVVPKQALWDISIHNRVGAPNAVDFSVRIDGEAMQTSLAAGGILAGLAGGGLAWVAWPREESLGQSNRSKAP